MSEFEGDQSGQGQSFGTEPSSQESQPQRSVFDPGYSIEENPAEIEEAIEGVQQDLSNALAAKLNSITEKDKVAERVANIKPLQQESSESESPVDARISCARMAIEYYNGKDPGVSGLVEIAKQVGYPFVKREEGIWADPQSLHSVLQRGFEIEKRGIREGAMRKANKLIKSLTNDKPDLVEINIHNESTKKDRPILVIGYRFDAKMRGRMILVGIDPASENNGEIEIGDNLLKNALNRPMYFYSKTSNA